MRKFLQLSATALLLVLSQPALAQVGAEQPLTPVDQSLIGLPIVSSDGVRIGQVTEVGIDEGQAIVIAEIERPLGIGADAVAIPLEMFQREGALIVLTVTAAQVRDRLARPIHREGNEIE